MAKINEISIFKRRLAYEGRRLKRHNIKDWIERNIFETEEDTLRKNEVVKEKK